MKNYNFNLTKKQRKKIDAFIKQEADSLFQDEYPLKLQVYDYTIEGEYIFNADDENGFDKMKVFGTTLRVAEMNHHKINIKKCKVLDVKKYITIKHKLCLFDDSNEDDLKGLVEFEKWISSHVKKLNDEDEKLWLRFRNSENDIFNCGISLHDDDDDEVYVFNYRGMNTTMVAAYLLNENIKFGWDN